jgi:sugar lactone lactonase YvrE
MPITVKHSKVSSIPDDADTSLVRPSDWNADHTLVGLGTMAEQNANAVAITGGTATLASLDIATSGTDAQIAPNTGITGWNYSGLSKSITAEESAPTGLFLSPDGLNMYVNGSTGDDVNQYTLSTAWDVSTASFVRLFSTAAQDTSPQDVFFKPDGLSMFIMGATNDTVYQYTLSSAFNISTASYASKSFSVTSQETSPLGLWFKPDGTVMYVIGSATDTAYQYNLGTAWDVSTASYASISFNVTTQDSGPAQINLNSDGTKMWILGSTGDDITEYALGTAWNISTATFVNNFYVGFEETSPNGLFIDSTANNRVYMVGQADDTVYQYNTATNSISAVTDVFNTTSNARVQGNLAVQGSANIDVALSVQGNITGIGTTTFNSLTSSGTTTLATATSAQTVALGSGATVSGSLKT